MPAGIRPLCPEQLLRPVQGILKLGPRHPGLDRDRLILLLKGQDLVKPQPHIQGNSAPDRFHPSRHTAAAAVDIQGNLMRSTIRDDPLHLFRSIRVHHHIRHTVHPLLTQAQGVIASLSVSHGKPLIIPGRYKILSRDLLKRFYMFLSQGAGNRKLHLIHADITVVMLKVLIGHLKFFFYHFIEAFLWIFHKIRITPAENRTVAFLRSRLLNPGRLKSFIRFIHRVPPLFCSPAFRLRFPLRYSPF